MKLSLSVASALLVALAASAPVDLEERKTYGTTANEYTQGGCKGVILFFARGSTQGGNLGDMPGQQFATALSNAVGTDLAVQGINYSATLEGNFEDGGCPADEAAAMTTLLNQAATKCPSAKIVVAGYSQGAAMVHRSIESATATTVSRIAAAVTFGDTQKAQDGGVIPNIAKAKTKIYCNQGDLVCQGTLIITGNHLDYTSSVNPAVQFVQTLL
ncbi:putative cutinase [Seiridium cardinale]